MRRNKQSRKVDEAIRTAKRRMVLNAVLHMDELDARTGMIFQAGGVLNSAASMASPEFLAEIAAVLADQAHSQRVPVTSGPQLFRRADPHGSNVEAILVTDLLLSESPPVRAGALKHFEALATADAFLITPRSVAVLSERRESLVSDDSTQWLKAALAISDAVRDDWLCNLAGLRQSIQICFDAGVTEYIGRVLRPTTTAVDSINLEWWEPRSQKAAIETHVLSLINTETDLSRLLDAYFDRFGHLPFAEAIAMSRLVAEWTARNDPQDDTWDVIWRWADHRTTPVARYHACQTFLCLPHLVPDSGAEQLWSEVADVLSLPYLQSGEHLDAQIWQVRCELAKHYYQYFECLLPWNASERIAIMAWWMSEHVARLFGNGGEIVRHFREFEITPEEAVSDRQRLFIHPSVKPSELRYATLYTQSIWSLSLQTFIGAHLAGLSPDKMRIEDRLRIAQTLSRSLLSGFPLHGKKDEETVYAFDQTVASSAQAWIDTGLMDDIGNAARAWIAGMEMLSHPSNIVEALPTLGQQNEEVQALICRALRTAAYTQQIDPSAVWHHVENHEWRNTYLQTGDAKALNVLFMALSELQVSQGGQWSYLLPHYYALASEGASGNRERQKLLFGFTILSSLSSDTVSALQRLLRGKVRHDFAEDVLYWRERIEEVRHQLLPWPAARIRAVSAALYL